MKSKETQCDGCAFKPGAVANREPYNAIRGEVCALGAIPFFCHHDIDWKAQHSWSTAERKAACRASGVCGGWVARVRVLHAKGFFGEYRVIRQAIAKQFLEAIDIWTNKPDGPDGRRYLRLMKRMLRFLSSRDIAKKKLPLLYG